MSMFVSSLTDEDLGAGLPLQINFRSCCLGIFFVRLSVCGMEVSGIGWCFRVSFFSCSVRSNPLPRNWDCLLLTFRLVYTWGVWCHIMERCGWYVGVAGTCLDTPVSSCHVGVSCLAISIVWWSIISGYGLLVVSVESVVSNLLSPWGFLQVSAWWGEFFFVLCCLFAAIGASPEVGIVFCRAPRVFGCFGWLGLGCWVGWGRVLGFGWVGCWGIT